MKRFTLLLLGMFACLYSTVIYAQTDKDAMMKAWTAYMTPSDIHKSIAESDGVWNTSMTMWMDPGAKPVMSKGTCTNKMVMGGRYQESSFAGDFMGMPMEGKGTLGYDNAKKTFQSTWIDNMGTGIMTMSGTWDDATKTLNLTGTSVDPATGKDVKVRETHQIIDNDNQLMTMYMIPDGMPEVKTMEIKYTRQ